LITRTSFKSGLLVCIYFLLSNFLSSQSLIESDLPIIQIETDGPISGSIKVNGSMQIAYDEANKTKLSGPYNIYDGQIGIEFRGASSLALFPKKGYAIETRDSLGENLNIPILGLPKENDWVLHGPYSDKSLMRNALAYSIAADIMPYAPKTRFCELMINGEYLGVYLFTEKIKRDKNRVAISKLESEEIEGEDVTGGYILKFDKYEGEEVASFRSDYPADLRGIGSTFFQYHYPKPSDIVPAQEAYIQSFIKDLEDAIMSADYTDPESGYRKYLDTRSFIDLIFVNEIAKNVDGYRLSTYMYKDKDDISPKLHMGPVWDYNLAFGNADYCTKGDPTGLVFLEFNKVCDRDNWIVHFWWERLWRDPAFKVELGNRWVDLREDLLSTDRIVAKIDSFENLLQESQGRNFVKWPIIGKYIWPNYNVYTSYANEVNGVRDFIKLRMPWLDIQFAGLASSNENLLPESELLLYPSPTLGEINILFNAQENIPEIIKIYSTAGQVVRSVSNNKSSKQVIFDVSNLESGIYHLIATTRSGKFYLKKFVKS